MPEPSTIPDSHGELDLLRAYLRERDVACPACGHNLRGTAHLACPECGARLDLRVTSMDMPHKWWITRMLGFALPLGLFGALAGAGTWSLAHSRLERRDAMLLAVCWGVTLLCAGGVGVLARRRTRFIQRPLARQRVNAILSWIVMLVLSWAMVYVMTRTPYDWPWTLIDSGPLP